MARLVAKRRTIGFARQTALTTENTTASDFTYFPCVFPDPDHAQEQEDFSDLQSGQAGAFEPPAPGSKSGGSITVQFPMSALKTGYDPTSEDPGDAGVISPAAVLLANAIGSAGNSAVSSAAEFAQGYHMARTGYVATDVAAGSTTTAINVNTGASYTTGSAVMVDSSASAGSPAFGWITDITSGTPDVITIAAASAVTAAASDNSYGVATGYMSGNDTVPLTFRVSGDNSAFLDTYIGCVAKSIKLDLAAKKTAMCEIVFQFADRKRYGSGGGIQDIASFQRVRPTLATRAAASCTTARSPAASWRWSFRSSTRSRTWSARARRRASPSSCARSPRLSSPRRCRLIRAIRLRQTWDRLSRSTTRRQTPSFSSTWSRCRVRRFRCSCRPRTSPRRRSAPRSTA